MQPTANIDTPVSLLGKKCRDTLTGHIGTATSVIHYLDGTSQASMASAEKPEGVWISTTRLPPVTAPPLSPAQPAALSWPPLSWRAQAVAAYHAPAAAGPRLLPFTATNLPGHADDASEAIGWFDAHTGLDWLASSAQEHTHANAEAYCKALADLGHSDWRLPTIRELLALVDYDQRNPAVDRAIAHLVKAEWHWSSSPVPGNPDCARGVSFGYGYSDYDHRSGAFHVLACRGGVAPAGVSPGQ